MWKESQLQTQTHASAGTQTSCHKHFLNTCNMKFNPSKCVHIHQHFHILVYRTTLTQTKFKTLSVRCKMTCSILYGHLHTHTHTHTHTHAHTHTHRHWLLFFSSLFFSSCTGAWTGQSSLFKRGCFEFQRGAHERAAEYKGVPKDTLQRSMWGQFSPDGKPGSKAWPP